MQEPPTELKRSLSLPVITFYGLGTIVGAGIYVLVGKVAGAAGDFFPYSFLLAGAIAAITALTYSELAARYPKSAGAALYAEMAYRRRVVSQVIGWMVILTGVVSAATIINGFHGYLSIFVPVPKLWAEIGLALVMTAIAAWGIKESAWLISAITLTEISGLIYVIVIAGQAEPVAAVTALPDASYLGLFLGSFLAFYAFIGFEDMVNVVEEVRRPRKTLPIAILTSVGIATVFYVMIAFVAQRAMPASELAASAAPLADLVAGAGVSPQLISAISLVAVVNGALVQIIMASRVMYGMTQHDMAPKPLGVIHPHTRTPVRATVLAGAIVLAFALWLPLQTLASLTSLIMLSIYTIVNIGLVVIKRRDGANGGFEVPIIVPLFGALTCAALMLFQLVA